MADMLEVIKQAAVEAVQAAKPMRICFGKVETTDPLAIRLNDQLVLDDAYFLIGETVKAKLFLKQVVKGDRVLLLMEQGGQRFFAADLLPADDWNPELPKGEPAKSLNLVSSRATVTFYADGTLKDASLINLIAIRQNYEEPIVWTTTPHVPLGGTGNSRTLPPAVFQNQEQITVQISAGELIDYVTIVRVQDGAAGKDAMTVQVWSSRGELFDCGDLDTQLTARVLKGGIDITNDFPDTAFLWLKKLSNGEWDEEWNSLNHWMGRSIHVTDNEAHGTALFECQVDYDQRGQT